MSKKNLLVSIISSIIMVSCGGKTVKEKDTEEIVEVTDTIKTTQFNISGELFSVPSPIQTALLIQKSGISYDKAVLNPSNKVNTFITDYVRSLNLGIYGADLGYVSLYNQTQDAIGYLASVKQLADRLGISVAFNITTMERIQKNITNKDSMMVLVGIAYRSSDAYLKTNQRNDLSSLILAGGWIESLYFSTSAFKSKPNDELKYLIAEQKQSLNSLIKILGNNSSVEVVKLTEELKDLGKVYDGIEFNYKYFEPVTDAEKHITYINSKTEVTVSREQVEQISEKIKNIREKIINIKQS